MLSNKLTFSLVLALMLALAFVATPVIAQDVIAVGAVTANGFAVVTQLGTSTVATNGIDGTTLTTVDGSATMPDLEELLRFGGTIELQRRVAADDPDAATMTGRDAAKAAAKGASADATADEKKASLWRKAVISEIMWGLDTPSAGPDGGQWIEVHSLDAAVAGADAATALRLVFYPNERTTAGPDMVRETDHGGGDPNTTLDAVWVLVDRVSTVNRFGQPWTAKGMSGNALQATGEEAALSNLVSMYRKAALKDGKYELKDGLIKDLGDGTSGGSWEASAVRANMMGNYIGTPGTFHIPHLGAVAKHDKAAVAADGSGSGVIINEIRDDTSQGNIDWIELHNHNADGTDPVSVKNWRLWLVTDADEQAVQAILPDYKIPAGGYLLIVNRDPSDPGSPLAGGINLADVVGKNEVNRGAKHVYHVSDDLNLPGSGKYLLVLRSGDKSNTHEQFVDFAGNGFFKKGSESDMWPLRGWSVPGDRDDFNVDTLASATMSIGRVGALTDKGVYRGKSRAGNRLHKDDWQMFENQGSIGYDRDVDPLTSPGTPGYGNEGGVNLISDDRKNTVGTDDYAFGGTITISEIMYDAGPNWNLVQWIELYNSSLTEAVNLEGWKVEIQNKEDVQSYVDASFMFVENTVILPNQSLLLVSRSGANDVMQQRVYDLYKNHRDDLNLPTGRVASLLSRTGFNITLYAKLEDRGGNVTSRESMMVVDQAGNLMVSVADASREVMWELPERNPEARRSIVRQYGDKMRGGSGHEPANDGTMEDSWNSSILSGAGLSYYGHRNDIGTPGWRLGSPLPVELASFRPVRDDATGHVVIRWATESELNNAGFNILRSETKNG